MPWVAIIWSMIAAVCLTLAAIYGLVWYRNRTAWAYLLFSVTAASATAFTFFELWMLRAETPGELLTALRWAHVPLFFWLVSITWFVWSYLAAGRRWLAWTVCGLRAFFLLLNFIVEPSINYREVPSLRHLQFLGVSVTVPEGLPNPWTLIGHAAAVLLLLYVADAGVTAWRRGDHRKAVMVGGGIEFFLLFGTIEGVLRSWAGIEVPVVFSPLYLGIVAVMAYELSHDVLRASHLVRELREEVSARKQAEQEAHVLRQEIAHAGRVSMMGQLASGLAHEINQPLAAILRNAEAAEMYLQHASPDLDEIRAILADIRADDERAGHVIDRMRGLLKHRALDTRRLEVGSLVRDVAALLRVDAAARQVKLNVSVPGDLPPVHGDRVHIQQVLLNLVINGMDALNGARSPEDRRVSVTARVAVASGAPAVEIGVDDAGPGIPLDRLAQIFDPFFTTKPTGMGMGLAISRTIIEAHGGRIWAENKDSGGAVFRFTLPIAAEGDATFP